ncbi:MAG: hypothetical protein IPJ65_24110 [Archangiaceae bacterium]|nr:hypothetical protein [Archangiaceae bacterium]
MGLRITSHPPLPVIQDASEQRQQLATISTDRAPIDAKAKTVRELANTYGVQQDVISHLRESQGAPALDASRVLGRQVGLQAIELGDRNLARYQQFLSDSQIEGKGPTDAQIDTLLALVGNSVTRMETGLLDVHASRATPEQRQAIMDTLGPLTAAQKKGARRSMMMKFLGTETGVVGGAVGAALVFDSIVGTPLGLPMAGSIGMEYTFKRFNPEYYTRTAASIGLNRLGKEAVDNDLLFLHQTAEAFEKTGHGDSTYANQVANVIGEMLAMRASLQPQGNAAEKPIVDALSQYATLLRAGSFDEAHQVLAGINEKDVKQVGQLPLARAPDAADVAQAKDTMLYVQTRAAAGAENRTLVMTLDSMLSKHVTEAAGGDIKPFSPAELQVIRSRTGPNPSPTELMLVWPLHQDGLLDVHDLWPGKLNPVDRETPLTEVALHLEDVMVDMKRGRVEKLVEASPKYAGYLSAPLSMLFVPLHFLAIPIVLAGRMGAQLTATALSNKVKNGQLETGLDSPDGNWNLYGDWLSTAAHTDDLFAGTKEQVTARLKVQADALQSELDVFDFWDRAGATNPASKYIVDRIRPFPAALAKLATESGSPEELRSKLLSTPEFQSLMVDANVAHATFVDLAHNFADPEQLATPTEQYFNQKLRFVDEVNRALSQAPSDAKTELAINEQLADAARGVARAYRAVPREKLLGMSLPFQPRTIEKDTLQKVATKIAKKPNDGASIDQLKEIATERSEIEAMRNAVSVVSEKRAGEIAQETLDALWTQVFPFFGTVTERERNATPKLKKPQIERLEREGERPEYRVSGELSDGGKLTVYVDGVGMPNLSRADFCQLQLGEQTLERMAGHALALRLGDAAKEARSLGPLKNGPEGTHSTLFEQGGQQWQVAMTPSGYVAGIQPWSP